MTGFRAMGIAVAIIVALWCGSAYYASEHSGKAFSVCATSLDACK